MFHARPVLSAAFLAAALALGPAGCPKPKQDFTGKVDPADGPGPAPPAGDPDKAATAIRRPVYEPPDDTEDHRLDMVEFEHAAYVKLRKFSVGQRAFVEDVRAVDLDDDGVCEYAYLLELMGASNCRTPGGTGLAPLHQSWPLFRAADAKGRPFYDRKTSGAGFVETEHAEYYTSRGGDVFWLSAAGVAQHRGYYFLFFLPSKKGVARNAGQEVPPGDPEEADLHERRFAAVAWPVRLGVTGRRAFAVYRPERIWSRWIIEPAYDGATVAPEAWAALDRDGPAPRNLDAEPASEGSGRTACDGGRWRDYGETPDRPQKDEDSFEWKWTKQQEIEQYKADGGPDARWMRGAEKKRPKKASGD